MIIVRLIGGLGNQMFQYAAARRLAEKHSTTLKLDITGFEEYKLRTYSLHCFHVWEHLATKSEIEEIRHNSQSGTASIIDTSNIETEDLRNDSRNLLSRLKRKFIPKPELEMQQQTTQVEFEVEKYSAILAEKYFHFDAEVLEARNNIILDGYWQSEKYFSDIPDILHREFTIKYPQDFQSRRFADLIQSTNSISLHLRRTDYVQDALTNKIHGACDQSYYDRCVKYIAEQVSNPHFFVFSDEPQWAKENLQLGFPTTIVDCNDASRNYEDLRLMSMCKHNIIANSSFSWWGAWLNSNPSKLVLAPRKWFNDETRNTRDLIPEQWTKL